MRDQFQPAQSGNFDRHFIARGARLNMHHTVGTRFADDEKLSVTDAFKRINMMWPVHRIEMKVKMGDHIVKTGQYALVRGGLDGEAPEFLSMASEDYQPIQNAQFAHWLDAIAAHYPVEGAGYVGTSVMVAFSGTAWAVQTAPGRRDELKDSLYAVNSFKPGTAVMLKYASTAMYCTNQVPWIVSKPKRHALGDGSKNRDGKALTLAHSNNGYRAIEYIAQRMAELSANEPTRHAFIQYLAERPLTLVQRQAAILAAFPEPTTPRLLATVEGAHDMAGQNAAAAAIASAPELREMVEKAEKQYEYNKRRNSELRDLVEESLEDRGIGGTAYAVLQAIGEVLEWREGQRGDMIGFDMLVGDRANVISRAQHEIAKYIDVRAE